MYKSRFTRWNQRKNYTKSEKKDVIDTLKTVHVTGEPRPVPTIRGRKAEMNRIRRYCRQEQILEEFVTLLPRSSIDKRKRMNVTASSYRGRKAHSQERRTTTTLAADSQVASEAARGSRSAPFDPERPFSLTSELARIEVVLMHTKIILDGSVPYCGFTWSSGDSITWMEVLAGRELDNLQDPILGSAFFVLVCLYFSVTALARGRHDVGWSVIHKACNVLEMAMQNDPASLIIFLIFAFGEAKWDRVPDLRARLWRYITRLAVLKHGCKHPLSIIAYHLQEQPTFSRAYKAARNIIEPFIREEGTKLRSRCTD